MNINEAQLRGEVLAVTTLLRAMLKHVEKTNPNAGSEIRAMATKLLTSDLADAEVKRTAMHQHNNYLFPPEPSDE